MKFLKWTGIISGILFLLFVALHIWINYTAKQIVQDLVESRSNGRLKMKIEKFRLSWFSKRVDLTNAIIYSVDSVNCTTAYKFQVKHIKLSVQEIFPILFENKLLIDSLNLDKPAFTVTRIKSSNENVATEKKQVSIPEELGKIYNSIQDALKTFRINRFQIDNASIRLVNKLQPEQKTMTINNIHFHIDNLSVEKNLYGENEKLLFSDNVVLSCHDQDIIFPDGRHQLAFSNFKINLKQQYVEFDSCTILAEQKESDSSRFRVFFDTLRLNKIDFDTLYKTEVIKADSVYCLNSRFDLDVENTSRKSANKKNGPRLEQIVQQLTGDLLLGSVLIRNADFHINTNTGEHQASFNFTNNTFELQGLKVSRKSAKPITVKNVALAIRNYENFIRDSSYKLSFDSILIREDRVFLDRFVLNNYFNKKIISSISIPRFELSGLYWDDLVFNQQLKAKEATLYNPVINYTASAVTKAGKGKKSIFTTLGNIGQLIQLDKMNITHGKVDITLKNSNAVHLEDASMTISTRTLFKARKVRALEPAVDHLNFKTGYIKAGNIEIFLNDVTYTGSQNGYLLARLAHLIDRKKEMEITAENAAVDDVLTDEESGDFTAKGIRWDKASVKLNLTEQKGKSQTAAIEINDLHGWETDVSITLGSKHISTQFEEVSIDQLKKEAGIPIHIKSPFFKGQNLKVSDSDLLLKVNKYQLQDKANSILEQLEYRNNKNGNMLFISAPLIKVAADINTIFANDLLATELELTRPDISYDVNKNYPGTVWPQCKIDHIRLIEPAIYFRSANHSGNLIFDWDGRIERNNFLEVKKLRSIKKPGNHLQIDSLNLQMNHFNYLSPGEKKYQAGNGEIEIKLSNFAFTDRGEEPAEWAALMNKLTIRHFTIDSLGLNKGFIKLDEAEIANLTMSDQTLMDPYKLTADNKRFILKKFTGQYSDPVKNFRWVNAGIDQQSGFCTIDSFTYSPTPTLDSFLTRLSFQKDYISTGCSGVTIGPIDQSSFTKDSVFKIGNIKIGNTWFNDYKDKRLPFAAGTIRPLPIQLISKIPVGIAIDTVQFQNAKIVYTEFSSKTNKAGIIPVSQMYIQLVQVKNKYLQKGDSLQITASGYVMDSIWTRLQVKAAYLDSSSAFRMTLLAKAGDIRVLNPALIPLVSVKLNSGNIDTISLRATGREYFAFGQLKMFYRNLSIRFLKSGKDERQAFMTRLKSFLANSFVIRKNNLSRTGDIFAYRKRDRSSINYLLKIISSGIGSSTGAKSNKKQLRHYRQELKQKGLPPFDKL